MDWKYKHFHQKRVFPEQRDLVRDAAQAFMTESLGWQVTSIPDGLTAQGSSFSHHAIAHLHIQTAGDGTTVSIELLVERAGWRGFMLFDVGGYYNIQLRKWLDGIQWSLHQKLTGTKDEAANPLVVAQNKTSAYIFNGCLVFIVLSFALYLVVTFISALVGLITGNLLLLGRNSPVIHGPAARILSALILLGGVFVAWRMRKSTGHRQSG